MDSRFRGNDNQVYPLDFLQVHHLITLFYDKYLKWTEVDPKSRTASLMN